MTFPESGAYLAHTQSLNPENNETVLIEFDNEGVLVSWLRSNSVTDIFSSLTPVTAPEPLIAMTSKGWITLNDGILQRSSLSTLGYSEFKFRYRRAVQAGRHGKDYSRINGLASKIDGLAERAEMWPTETNIEYDRDQNRLNAISIRSENLPTKHLLGEFSPHLETYFIHKPTGYDEVSSISGALVYKTHSESQTSWENHEGSHQMMADLMTLAYGRACRFTITSAWRKDDEVLRNGETVKRWKDVFAPSERREEAPVKITPSTTSPLFHLEELNSDKLGEWLSSKSPWRRALNIAVSTYFSKNLSSEMKYINVAIALEALGFSIGKECGTSNKQLRTFNDQVAQIVKLVGEPTVSLITKSSTPERWTTEAGNAYNGLKHANRKATDWRVAEEKAEEGLTLIRAWAAIELGVDAELVNERLKSH
ncbi:hypothetical protein [Actinomyces sp. oral taxon 170]|jgi:hypothetical protein|uniref:ApeA N-terminal domain 1-containing protein n=1 Tax=Actinomyces sp. oral taxon 170 TaxID=712117 RepID=UPI000205D3DE|nr:hypothetical protein [Actinomyces sp. oral taxon 170]EGF50258.1 conserved domain protein [Actinomyces sp. oral taxon 170 str. F0386]